MTLFLLPRMAETIGIYRARNFTFSVCSLRGSLIIRSSSIRQVQKVRGHTLLGCHRLSTGGEGALGMTPWLSQMAPGQSYLLSAQCSCGNFYATG